MQDSRFITFRVIAGIAAVGVAGLTHVSLAAVKYQFDALRRTTKRGHAA